jgi:hypothetical protein
MNDAVDLHEMGGVAMEDQLAVAVQAADWMGQKAMTMAEQWLRPQGLNLLVDSFEDRSGGAGTIGGDRFPDEFEVSTAKLRITQLSHDSGALF